MLFIFASCTFFQKQKRLAVLSEMRKRTKEPTSTLGASELAMSNNSVAESPGDTSDSTYSRYDFLHLEKIAYRFFDFVMPQNTYKHFYLHLSLFDIKVPKIIFT